MAQERIHINRHKRKLIHELMWLGCLHMVQASRTQLWDFTHKWGEGLTPGERKHLEETRDMLEECHQRILVVYARLKK